MIQILQDRLFSLLISCSHYPSFTSMFVLSSTLQPRRPDGRLVAPQSCMQDHQECEFVFEKWSVSRTSPHPHISILYPDVVLLTVVTLDVMFDVRMWELYGSMICQHALEFHLRLLTSQIYIRVPPA